MTWLVGALFVAVLMLAARSQQTPLSVEDLALARVLAVERRARAARERQELQDAYRAGKIRLHARPRLVASGRDYALPFVAGGRER